MERYNGYALQDIGFAGQPGYCIRAGMRIVAIKTTNVPQGGWFLEPYADYPTGISVLVFDDELPEYFDKRSEYP